MDFQIEKLLRSLITCALLTPVAAKRFTRGLIVLHEAKGEDGPTTICAKLNAVGGAYSQTSISLWLNAWRRPEGDARTHIRLAYPDVTEELWLEDVTEAEFSAAIRALRPDGGEAA